jgi:3',5'-cyclic AMP phosphodiesterase CpdA
MPYCALENRGEFLALLRRLPMVHAVISGHTHCAVDETLEGVRMLVAPSTFLQVGHPAEPGRPGASFWDVHTGDASRRGFRRLELHADGTIVTEVIWDAPGLTTRDHADPN